MSVDKIYFAKRKKSSNSSKAGRAREDPLWPAARALGNSWDTLLPSLSSFSKHSSHNNHIHWPVSGRRSWMSQQTQGAESWLGFQKAQQPSSEYYAHKGRRKPKAGFWGLSGKSAKLGTRGLRRDLASEKWDSSSIWQLKDQMPNCKYPPTLPTAEAINISRECSHSSVQFGLNTFQTTSPFSFPNLLSRYYCSEQKRRMRLRKS